ncbi:hypothetical protein PUN28_001936 [Cardiocondyla obscurior]|uniref:Secreted protein n=1 Tax=Cardiocondyla obscurior TaxID=286306 RepID=A0AAW2GRS3_9HYME
MRMSRHLIIVHLCLASPLRPCKLQRPAQNTVVVRTPTFDRANKGGDLNYGKIRRSKLCDICTSPRKEGWKITHANLTKRFKYTTI